MRTFALKEIRPNPFRNIDRYPILPEKIEALRESFRTTTFWDNLLARVVDGSPEVAYGHHRLQALREEFGPKHEIPLTIRPLSDAQMLQIMARENMEEWGTKASIEQETIRAVVDAYAADRIVLDRPDKFTSHQDLRVAPSFRPGQAGAGGDKLYSATTLANFLGWVNADGGAKRRVYVALDALALLEQDVISARDLEGLGTREVEAVVRETEARLGQRGNGHRNRAAAKKVARTVSRHLKSPGTTIAQARSVARTVSPVAPKTYPNIDRLVEKLAVRIDRVFRPHDLIVQTLQDLFPHRDTMTTRTRQELVDVLLGVRERAEKWADKYAAGAPAIWGEKR
jgi:ParB-like nuclease family protein